MSEIKSFTDLNTWKSAHKLTVDIYIETKKYPKEETYGLVSQIRRASSSIMANIAEGFARYPYKDKTRFYYHARASLAEVQNHLYLSQSLDYISEIQFSELLKETGNLGQLINGLINSTKKQLSN